MQDTSAGQGKGLEIGTISDETFRQFACRFANSPEIGPIGTCLDHDAPPCKADKRCVVGLSGCGTLCAAACFELFQSKRDASLQVLKLDSVVVNPGLRRRGLAGLLVAQSLLELLSDGLHSIAGVYAHAVHPATRSLLGRMGFSDPPVTGAPISQLQIEPEDRQLILQRYGEQARTQVTQKKLQCAHCRTDSLRATPWCRPREA